MVKKSNNQAGKSLDGSAVNPASGAGDAMAAGSSKKARKSAAPAKTKAATKRVAAGGAKRAGKKSAGTPKKKHEPSDADIRLRAYFIAERRVQLALQGDPGKDWLEAKRQLLEEAAAQTRSDL